MKLPSKEKNTPQATEIQVSEESQQDNMSKKLKEAIAQRRSAEQRAEELTNQLATSAMEIMRLKAEIYDLTHGLA
jgi:hypothetical protein